MLYGSLAMTAVPSWKVARRTRLKPPSASLVIEASSHTGRLVELQMVVARASMLICNRRPERRWFSLNLELLTGGVELGIVNKNSQKSPGSILEQIGTSTPCPYGSHW